MLVGGKWIGTGLTAVNDPATVKTIAPRFGISDVALSKLCDRHGIPQPPRGYWAKAAAGKPTPKASLPTRGFGIRDVNTEPRQVPQANAQRLFNPQARRYRSLDVVRHVGAICRL